MLGAAKSLRLGIEENAKSLSEDNAAMKERNSKVWSFVTTPPNDA